MLTYINHEGQQKIKTFVYKGGTDSLSYKHLWSPFADFLLQFTPSSIAPNVITLISLIILGASHILFVLGVQYQQKIDSWRMVLMGISILVYQNLDNLDGKQARKTKSSSPLGMLFDHGTDALCSILISSQVLELLQFQSGNLKLFILLLFVMLIYFAAMWSQYCMGFFRLGSINPIDEGLPSYAIFAFCSVFVPFNFWNTLSPVGTYNQILVGILAFIVVLIIYFMVHQNYKNTKRDFSDINYALLLPLTFLSVLIVLYFQQSNALHQAYWPIVYALMFSWSRNMIHIQVCAVTQQLYNPFNSSTISFALLSLGYLVVNTEAKLYFTGVATILFVLFLEYVVSVSNQIARVLGIKVFSIKKSAGKGQ